MPDRERFDTFIMDKFSSMKDAPVGAVRWGNVLNGYWDAVKHVDVKTTAKAVESLARTLDTLPSTARLLGAIKEQMPNEYVVGKIPDGTRFHDAFRVASFGVDLSGNPTGSGYIAATLEKDDTKKAAIHTRIAAEISDCMPFAKRDQDKALVQRDTKYNIGRAEFYRTRNAGLPA